MSTAGTAAGRRPAEELPAWTRADDRAAFRHTPYVGQWRLHHRLSRLVRHALDERGSDVQVLEVGAGHGSWSGELLAAGARTTLVELTSAGKVAADERFGRNDRYASRHDPGGTLAGVDGTFSMAVLTSVLHHVPDYVALVQRVLDRLEEGGTLLTVQDPLWYPRCTRATRVADRTAYLAWRVAQGEVGDGLRAWRRRLRGAFPDEREGEVTYHHVVRSGVDEEALRVLLGARFRDVALVTYWSNHLGAVAPLAEPAGLRNTFALRATGFTG